MFANGCDTPAVSLEHPQKNVNGMTSLFPLRAFISAGFSQRPHLTWPLAHGAAFERPLFLQPDQGSSAFRSDPQLFDPDFVPSISISREPNLFRKPFPSNRGKEPKRRWVLKRTMVESNGKGISA